MFNKIELFLRSLAFYIFYIGYTLIAGPICILICIIAWPFMSFQSRFNFLLTWVDAIMWALRVTCNIRFEIRGLENIPETPCVIMANHQSTWETLYSYKIFKPQTTVLKRELLWIPIFGWGLSMLKPIAINRSKKQQALKYLMKQAPVSIRNGFWYMVYPEGTRVNPGAHIDYASGSSLIACKNNFNVLPIAHNAGYCWPARTFLKYPGRITLSIGQTISSEGKKAKELTKDVELWIRKEQIRIGDNL